MVSVHPQLLLYVGPKCWYCWALWPDMSKGALREWASEKCCSIGGNCLRYKRGDQVPFLYCVFFLYIPVITYTSRLKHFKSDYRNLVCSWPVSWIARVGIELLFAEWRAPPGTVFRKACSSGALAYWCCQWKPRTNALSYHSEKQLGCFKKTLSKGELSHVLFPLWRRVWSLFPLRNTSYTSVLWKIGKQGSAWPCWHDMSPISGACCVCQWTSSTWWRTDPHCRAMQEPDGHWTWRMWSFLLCFCRVC